MGLRDIGASLPPGFRFYPSDEELVCHYLYKKITNDEALKGTLVEIDLHVCEPWQLPEVAKLNANEWYFFSFRDRKYATGFRTNRATTSGYWKATGKDRIVLDPISREIVGMRKTLVFYKNRAPNGIKTGWIMHEFRLETPHMPPKEDWVLCRVFHKSKGENSTTNNYNSEFMFHTPPTPQASLNLSPITDHKTCSEYHLNQNHQQLITSSLQSSKPPNQNHQQVLPNHDQQNNSFLNLLQKNNTTMDDHDYGFVWEEMACLDHGGLGSDLDDMRLEIDNNNMVFL